MKVISSQAVANEEVAALRLRTEAVPRAALKGLPAPAPRARPQEWHDQFLGLLRRRSVPALRITLGLIFLWFGALKLFDASPVMKILESTYNFLPLKTFAVALGAWEVLIGGSLLAKRGLRCALPLLCLHLAGTFAALGLAPSLFFHDGNPLLLTVEGEFVVKNMVLMAAALVICGHEVEPLRRAPNV